jgi:quinoprotein glucose dehydrogenase
VKDRRRLTTTIAGILVAVGSLALQSQSKVPSTWLYSGGDKGHTRFSPLDQVTAANVHNLKILWRRPALDPSLKQAFPDLSPSGYYKATPILIDGVLYAPNAVGLIEAFEPATGKTLWVQQPHEATLREAGGQSTRGVDYWRRGSERRIIANRGNFLYSLDATTGRADPDFGERGRVSLKRAGPYAAQNFNSPVSPVVVGDVIVVAGLGGGGGDLGVKREAAPDDVRGFNVRTGDLVWTFHVRPRAGEFGADTWGGDSLEYSGDLGAWGSLTVDEELGYVYIPLTAPSNATYGGHRPGQNLFSNALVCLDAKTGKRVWHFQMVHHDLWDYDNVGAPVLGDLNVNGRRIKAVMQVNKTGFVYTFDRKTGEPVWPIEERPVPASTVPGEQAWPTQPYPTRPPAFDRQGITEADLIDFTPAIRAEALEVARRYVLGPMFTPPSLATEGGTQGTIVVPGTWGAANWNTPSFDPETGIFFAASITIPYINDLVEPPQDPRSTLRYALKGARPPQNPPPGGAAGQPSAQGTGTTTQAPAAPPPSAGPPASGQGTAPASSQSAAPGASQPGGGDGNRMQRSHEPNLASGLPILKPPYGRLTALDMNRGTLLWSVPNGDGPRNHPMLKDLNLPPLGTPGRAAPLVTRTLLFIGEGSDAIPGVPVDGFGNHFRAYDKATGKVIWDFELPVGSGTTGGPMTYLHNGKQYILVPIGGRKHPAEILALGLP